MSSEWTSVLLTSDFPPRTGGISNYLAQLYSRMQLSRHLIVAPRWAGDGEWDERAPLCVRRARITFARHWANEALYRRPFDRLLRPPAMAMALAAEGPRVPGRMLHCGQVMSAGLVGWMMQRLYGDPYLLYLYAGEIRKYSSLKSTGRLFRSVLAQASGVVAVSAFTLGEARPFLSPGTASLVVQPGVECERFRPECGGRKLRQRLGLDERPVLLTVSRLVPAKGHARVINSLPRVLRAHPETVYLVVGTGPAEPTLRALVSQMGLDEHVRFLGSVPDSDLPAYFDAADLFILASLDQPDGQVEGFGMALLEASAAGTPVVATRSGGNVEAVLTGETGVLLDQRDRDGLGDALVSLLDDPKQRELMGRQGREFARECMSWESRARPLHRWLLDRHQASDATLSPAICQQPGSWA